MTIAITATQDSWSAPMDERFGRAGGFFLVEDESGQRRYIDNNGNVNAAHGAGTGSAQTLISEGVQLVITGRIGPKAGEALRAAGIEVLELHGEMTVEQAYQHYHEHHE